MVVRRSLHNIYAQIVEFYPKGDKTLIAFDSRHLQKIGWKGGKSNTPTAYLVGLLIGKKAAEKGIKEAILDIGLQKSKKGSKVYAVLKGVVDAGVAVPHSDEMLPGEDRITGAHISKYANTVSKDRETVQFSLYHKEHVDLGAMPQLFSEMKKKIMGA